MSFAKKEWENKGESGYEDSKINADNLNDLETRIYDEIENVYDSISQLDSEKFDKTGGDLTGGLTFSSIDGSDNRYIHYPNGAIFIRAGKRLIISTAQNLQVTNYDNNAFMPVEASNFIQMSDKKIKKDIKNIKIDESLNLIKNLDPKKYKLANEKTGKFHHGFIAQDVKKACEKLNLKNEIYDKTTLNGEDFYCLNYLELIPDLVNCIKFLLDKEN